MGQIIDHHARVIVIHTVEGQYADYPYHEIQTDKVDNTLVDPSFPGRAVRDFAIERHTDTVPTCVGNSPVDLTIRTNVGSAIVNDDYVVTPHSTDKKYIKISIVRNDTSGLLEIQPFEKTTGNYGNIPAGKTLEMDLKEFSVVASGTVLVEEEDFI